MNPKKKPDYDAEKILQDLMEAAVETYREKKSLRVAAAYLELNPIKIRKLLITARERDIAEGREPTEVYWSPMAEEVLRLKKEGKTIKEIMALTNLSRASVNSYLPYSKVPYKADELSTDAEKAGRYRGRKAALEYLRNAGGTEALWSAVSALQEYPFYTEAGVKFTYRVLDNGNIRISKEDIIITRENVENAYREIVRVSPFGDFRDIGAEMLVETLTGIMGTAGAIWLYPVFVRLGIVKFTAELSE
ncbi:MAG: hypothetical protein LUI39_11885 [Lachnospiraceae bacterium]|nr:hypothetical protein [Lachnospiraceae bacterium]